METMWAGLLPDDVEVAWGDPREGTPDLLPEEAALLARAVPKRRQELAYGRDLARLLLRRFGIERFALLSGADREPLWPAGIVGSITHTEGACAVAVARAEPYAGIGIDVEPDEPLEANLGVAILRPDERARLREGRFLDAAVAARLVFSAKEALYKCQFPVARRHLRFADVAITLAPDGTFSVELCDEGIELARLGAMSGRWARRGGFLLTAAWLPRASA
jgi:4'-phosphopantetheinyl transferase EntD